MSSFENAIAFVLHHEGSKYTNDPDDPGGETKYGIAKRYNPGVDIKNLTIDQAREIYDKKYWSPFQYKAIENNSLATRVFDMAVNCGHLSAAVALQSAVCACGQKIDIDGIVGKQTIGAVNAFVPQWVIAEFKVERCKYYRRQVKMSPKKLKYLAGWIERATS